MMNVTDAGGSGLLRVLKVLSNPIRKLGEDQYDKTLEILKDERNARKSILKTHFSVYVGLHGRQETDYDTSIMEASGSNSDKVYAFKLAMVKLYRQMVSKGIEKIVDGEIETDDRSELGYPAYKVTVYGTSLRLKPED